ncbi:ribokinase [Rhodobium gokarnense]|uniref:Ribokinase n=1 Tax=Rhodobium gokarnense TaxID=364296 RepID=A0ABT3HAB8_9HYPH|nr:ribokinase [Rhodobium gokarnense]MCW2307347.1 ribokinase [Rhodobium gokarnense]
MSVIVLGSVNMDVVLSVNTLPQAGETIAASAQNLYPGGKGANQAIASARCGAPTAFFGAVGDDDYGAVLAKNLQDNGIDTAGLKVLAGRRTGQASIYVSAAGENSIVILAGANHDFVFDEDGGPVPVPSAPAVRLAQFEMPLAAIKAFFDAPGAASGTRILNPAPALPDGRFLFDLSDILIVNQTELATYAGRPDAASSPEASIALARGLLSRDDQWVVVTLGADGLVAVGAGQEIFVAGLDTEVVDTTGAGDCFCGALAARLSASEPLRDALAFANAAAALAVSRRGAGPSMPTFEEVVARQAR